MERLLKDKLNYEHKVLSGEAERVPVRVKEKIQYSSIIIMIMNMYLQRYICLQITDDSLQDEVVIPDMDIDEGEEGAEEPVKGIEKL